MPIPTSRKPRRRKPTKDSKTLIGTLRRNAAKPSKAPKVDLRTLGIRTGHSNN